MSTDSNASHKAAGHVVSLNVLIGTWLALVALTVVTVAVARVDLGEINIVVALGIAAVKSAIVALIFMHLKYEGRFKTVVFTVAVLFAVILIGFVVFDTTQYQEEIREFESQQQAPAAEQPPAPDQPESDQPAPAGD